MSVLDVPAPAFMLEPEIQMFADSASRFFARAAPAGRTETEWQIVDDCLQLHGGYGYINDYPIARIYGGSTEIMKVIIARSL